MDAGRAASDGTRGAPGAVRLPHERVQPEQQAHAEDRDREEQRSAEPRGAIASGASQPTMSVSTTPMNIQPSSATMTGQARRMVGTSARRTSRWGIPATSLAG